MPCENRNPDILESPRRPLLIEHVMSDIRIYNTRDIREQSRALLARHCILAPMPLCLYRCWRGRLVISLSFSLTVMFRQSSQTPNFSIADLNSETSPHSLHTYAFVMINERGGCPPRPLRKVVRYTTFQFSLNAVHNLLQCVTDSHRAVSMPPSWYRHRPRYRRGI